MWKALGQWARCFDFAPRIEAFFSIFMRETNFWRGNGLGFAGNIASTKACDHQKDEGLAFRGIKPQT